MKKKPVQVHYNKSQQKFSTKPACGSTSEHSQFSRDRRKVTCELCKNSLAWKGREK